MFSGRNVCFVKSTFSASREKLAGLARARLALVEAVGWACVALAVVAGEVRDRWGDRL